MTGFQRVFFKSPLPARKGNHFSLYGRFPALPGGDRAEEERKFFKMGMEYFCCYHSYLRKLAKLSDQEVGRLFRALLTYSATGKTQELTGRENVAFDFIADDIDRAKEKYEEKCNTNREKAVKRWHTEESPSMRLHTTESSGIPQHTPASSGVFGNADDTKEKEKAKQKAKAKCPSSTPPTSSNHRKSYDIDEVEALSHFDIPDEL